MGLAPASLALEGRFTLHVLALVCVLGVVGAGLLGAADASELRARVENQAAPGPGARLVALHALSQRDPAAIDAALVTRLLADPEPRMRELVFTNVVSRHTGKQALAPAAAGLADPAERERALFWLQRDVASRRWITRADLHHYFETLRRSAALREAENDLETP